MLLATCLALSLSLPVKEREIAFKAPDGVELHGTYVEPEHAATAKCKALLLLPGSGPTDRNGNQPPGLTTDLLKQIAEDLAKHGIASFRFDKRAAHVNAATWPKDPAKLDDFFAFERFVDDAQAGFAILRKQPGVEAAHTGILGHSEGGLITIVLAAKLGREKLPSIALLGTAARRLDFVIEDQILELLHRQTTDQAIIKAYMDKLRSGIDYVRTSGKLPTDMPPGLQGLFSPGTAKILRSYYTIDPIKTISPYMGNVLLLQGELDSNVSAKKDFPLLKQALQWRKKGSFTSMIVPNASHNLKHIEKRSEPGLAGPAVPEALAKIRAWAETNL